MTGWGRWVGVALAAALGAGCRGSGGSAEADLRSAEGVVAGVSERAVQVRTPDGSVLEFPLREGVEVTLGGGESSRAVVTEGAPVRVSYRDAGEENELVRIDVEPRARSGDTGEVPAQGPFEAIQGDAGDATETRSWPREVENQPRPEGPR